MGRATKRYVVWEPRGRVALAEMRALGAAKKEAMRIARSGAFERVEVIVHDPEVEDFDTNNIVGQARTDDGRVSWSAI